MRHREGLKLNVQKLQRKRESLAASHDVKKNICDTRVVVVAVLVALCMMVLYGSWFSGNVNSDQSTIAGDPIKKAAMDVNKIQLRMSTGWHDSSAIVSFCCRIMILLFF